MDIQQIKYFSRVYEMRSFTQAADSLFISRLLHFILLI